MQWYKIEVLPVENREDYYDMEIKTYKESLKGRFERSELRELIEKIDNAI